MVKIKSIFLKFEGLDVGRKAIPIDYLGNLLRSFQAYFRKIVLLRNPMVKKAWTRLVITDINEGSTITKIELKQPELLLEKTYEEAKDFAIGLLNKFQLQDKQRALEEIKKSIPQPIDRISIYRSLKAIWSVKKITTSIGSGNTYSKADYVQLEKGYKKRIHKWLKEEYFKGVITIKGFLTRIKTDEPLSLTIKDENGEFIKVYYELEDLHKYKELLTKPVKIKGHIELIGNFRTIKKIEDIKEFNTITIQSLPKYQLTKALVFTIQYYEDGLLLSEPFIPLNLDLEVLSDLRIELQEYLDFLKETYVEVDPEKLSSKAKELREKIINLLNLGEI